MNDTTIIKSISNIHSIIVDLLIFIFLTFFALYFTLHIGLKLDKIILPGLKIEQLYIKWDEKIHVNIDSIHITKSNSDSSFDFTTLDSHKILQRSRILNTLFSEVIINRIQINELTATFSYKEKQKAFVNIYSPSLTLRTNVDMNEHYVYVNIKEFNDRTNKVTLQGALLADTLEQKLYGDINLSVAETLPLTLSLIADPKQLKIWGKSTHTITKPIEPVVRLAHLSKTLNPWIIDYLQGKALDIEYLQASLDYDNPISFLDTLDIKASYKDVKYVFAPGYAPAISKHVDLAFKDRILFIYPRNATFYGQPAKKTWIKIDFENPTNPLLSVDVDTTARLTPQLVTWLDGYDIGLPFYQKKGKTIVKLGLTITLDDLDIRAKGTFHSKKAIFNFSNTDINVKNVQVYLDNTDVTISSLNATLLNRSVNADITGRFNPVKERGHFDVSLNHFLFGEDTSQFNLDKKHGPLKFSYILQPKADRLILPKSYWNFQDKPIVLAPLHVPFAFSTLSGSVPTTLFRSEGLFDAYVSGRFDIKNLTTYLVVDLVKFTLAESSLDQLNVPVNVIYNHGLTIAIKQKSKWDINGNKVTLNSTDIAYKNALYTIKDASIGVNGMLKTELDGHYDINSGSGKLTLHNVHVKSDTLDLLNIDKDMKVYIKQKEHEHFVEVPLLNFKLKSDNKHWSMNIKNIHLLSTYSPLLQEYNVTKGSLHVKNYYERDKIEFYGYVPYPYPILVKHNIPVNALKFSGHYSNDALKVFVNKDIDINLKYNRLNIHAKDIGFNIFALLAFINDHKSDNTAGNDASKLHVKLQANNSYFYINKERRAPADRIQLEYNKNSVTAHLLYGKHGGAVLEYKANKELYIYGDHFNDIFMNNLAEFSDFKGGELSFFVNGKDDKLTGVIRVVRTVIKDYKAINNTFAFINTIPALVTFSLPNYNKDGLTLNEGYASLNYKKSLLNINGFHLDTPELKFNGKGTLNTNTLMTDVEVSLVTEATTNLSKIPLIGYILVGKDQNTSTTTLSLKGPMNDPVVTNTLAKDIGVGSFNILTRALTFPVHYVDQAQKAIKKASKKRSAKKSKKK